MLSGDEITPTLEEPSLPEFRGATLSLENELGTATSKNQSRGGIISNVIENEKMVTRNEADLSRHQQPGDSPKAFNANSKTNNVANSGMVITHGFFSSRNSMFQRAVDDSKSNLAREENGTFIGCWLLTMVDHWDNEKERLVLLYSGALFIVKYDFITLTLLDHERIPIKKIIQLTVGNIEYPSHSISPKFQYLAGRFSTILRGCINQPGELFNWRSTPRDDRAQLHEAQDSNSGEIRLERNGVRISWGTLAEPKLTQTWNPWSKDIPWHTFLSHPLFSTDHEPAKFDVKDFISNLRSTLQDEYQCLVEYKPIIMDTIIGLPSLVFNYSQFGFYRVRGKVSF